jgi:hypothetical protein
MEQIARDMREGTFPKKSEQTQREDAASAAQTPAYLEDLAQWADAAVGFFPVHGEKFKEIAIALRSGLNPDMREALERIRDFPIGGHTAAGAMALIARQALASPPPSQ